MKKIKSNTSYKLFFFLFVTVMCVAAILRLYKLGSVPMSMADDEVRLVYNAYSIAKTGRDLNGNFLPLATQIHGYTFNPVAQYVTAAFVGIFGLSPFVSRLPFALAGIGSVILVFFIARLLLGDRWSALLSAGVMAISVWHIQLSRFSFECGIALFFYLLGVYFFLRVSPVSLKMLMFSLISFFIGFHAYSGYKISYLPLLLVLSIYMRRQLNRMQFVIVLVAIVTTFGSLWYLDKTQHALTYGGSPFFYGTIGKVSETVELERRRSNAPQFLENLFHNKLTVLWREFLANYQYAFSPQYLFLDQEASGIFSVRGRGQFYIHEALLIMIGVCFLFTKKPKVAAFLGLLLFVAPLPSGLGPMPPAYTLRSSFMLLPLSVLVGYGLKEMAQFRFSPFIRIGSVVCIGGLYLYFFGSYLTYYYYDWVQYGAKDFSVAQKDVTQFILKNSSQVPNIVIEGADSMTPLHFGYYGAIDPKVIQKRYGEETVRVGTAEFRTWCLNLSKDSVYNVVPAGGLFIVSPRCLGTYEKLIAAGKLKKPDQVITSPEGEDEWYVFEF